MDGGPTVGGSHLIVDMSKASTEKLKAAGVLMERLEEGLRGAGFHVLQSAVHRFPEPGGGFTGFVLLSESHAAVHTYPEGGYLALDVFSCGRVDAEEVIDTVARLVDAQDVRIRRLERAPVERAYTERI